MVTITLTGGIMGFARPSLQGVIFEVTEIVAISAGDPAQIDRRVP